MDDREELKRTIAQLEEQVRELQAIVEEQTEEGLVDAHRIRYMTTLLGRMSGAVQTPARGILVVNRDTGLVIVKDHLGNEAAAVSLHKLERLNRRHATVPFDIYNESIRGDVEVMKGAPQ